MKLRNGFTLIEVMVVLGVSSVLILILNSVLVSISDKVADSFETTTKSADISALFSWMQSNLLFGELKIYGFTGATGDLPLASAMIPFQNLCSDLNSSCPGDTAILAPMLNLNKTPMVQAICALSAQTVLIDLSRNSLGQGTTVADGFNVSAMGHLRGGSLKITKGTILAFIDEPSATLFVADGPPVTFNPQYNSSTGLFEEARIAANPTCISLVQDPTGLVTVDLRPFVLPGSGTDIPSDTAISAAMGEFPVKMTSAKFLSIGRNASKKDHWGARICDENTLTSCSGKDFLWAENIGKVDFFEYFNIPLGTNAVQTRYSIGDNVDCSTLSCTKLPMVVPFRAMNTTEKPGVLDSVKFSLSKQAYIQKLEFQVEDISKAKKHIRRYYVEAF